MKSNRPRISGLVAFIEPAEVEKVSLAKAQRRGFPGGVFKAAKVEGIFCVRLF